MKHRPPAPSRRGLSRSQGESRNPGLAFGQSPGQNPGHNPERRDDGQRRPKPSGSHGLWLYGPHAVVAALQNPQRKNFRLLLTSEAAVTLAAQLPDAVADAEQVDRPTLDKLLGRDCVHQGIALMVEPLARPDFAETIEREGPVLVLDQVTDPRNVGAILRSAAAFGAACVIVQDRNAPEETGALAKAASGALEIVPLLRAVNISRTIKGLQQAGYWCIGLDAGAGVLDGDDLRGRKVALVLGAEGEGLRRLTRETCDEILGLPISGAMESLNVSVAASLALYEVTRRMTASGKAGVASQ